MNRPTRIEVANETETGAPNRSLDVFYWPEEGRLHIDAYSYERPWNATHVLRLDLATTIALRDALTAAIEACDIARAPTVTS